MNMSKDKTTTRTVQNTVIINKYNTGDKDYEGHNERYNEKYK